MKFKLGDLCEFQKGYAFKSKDFVDNGEYIVKVTNLTNDSVEFMNCVKISYEKAEEYKKYELNNKDIIITTVGSWPNNPNSIVGKVVRVPNIKKKAFLNQNAVRVRGVNINQDFLYYLLRDKKFSGYLIGTAQGSASQASINQKDIKDYTVDIPDNNEQKAIAKILSDLDEKIEVNNKINKNLEEMAQAIFKQWFVDFEFPNEEGKPYKSSGGEMVKSELGMIPKGWEKCTLDKVANVSAGGDKPKKFSKIACDEYTVPIYSNGIDREGLYGYTDKAKILEESVTVSARGTIGYVCLRHQPYVPIVRLISVTPNTKLVSAKYLYFLLKRTNIIGTGTTQQQLTVPDFKKTKMYVPQYEYMKKFTIIVNSWFERINNNNIENERLEKLRDTLLPKLMSGEIRVPLETNEN
ncbi:restriction endonuclease subunit S [Clostridium perfringens]|uniref:restriction endonuclease subunit S n=1 Tax=Clostridium perfringens TaxID=1502 RepID=UPI002109D912|nr:restriction endonuclease subunit S [Clostridium perfringens]